ncbi:hypothetical protein AB0J35_54550 [Nonomuraea angiospora]|uniref:hypothetical protein n=1 Tax=Nonomuraea angiospora TaxID=46172 RepID=UPI00342DF8DC
MQRESRIDMAGYAGLDLDLDRSVRRSSCSWERPGWIHVHLPAGAVGRATTELGGPALQARNPAPGSGELIGAVLKSPAAATAAGADELYADAAA